MENRKEQKEALQTLAMFNKKLIENIPILADELVGTKLDDTEKFYQSTIDAINWEVQVMNGTLELLNEDRERVDKDEFNEGILNLCDALKTDSDERKAEALNLLVPQFENLQGAIEEVLV